MTSTLALFQVDAFATKPFEGNPAAVMPLKQWLDDELLQRIAQENNLSETAYFVAEGEAFRLRWFTPVSEVALCGHATLASAFVLMTELEPERTTVTFNSKSGPLHVTRDGDRFQLDFPLVTVDDQTEPVRDRAEVERAIGAKPIDIRYAGDDILVRVETATDVRDLTPDPTAIRRLCQRGLMVTAAGDETSDANFVSRFFAPGEGIDEDPVTGSAHCALAPYWGKRLGKKSLRGRQLSARGGVVDCVVDSTNKRVALSGQAVLVLRGEMIL